MKAFARRSLLIALVLPVAAAAAPARADDDPDYKPGPWHYRSITCVDSTVTSRTPRLGEAGQTTFTPADYEQTGVIVTFATTLGLAPLFAHQFAAVTHYQGDATNPIMIAERPGDRVQVCFLGGPAPTASCNPDTDSRGRRYRVYDYARHKQYWGMNEEHDCGGA